MTSTYAAEDADSVLRDADIAMYEAKRTGRARYVMFEPAMRSQVNDSVSLENDLRDALAQGGLELYYQPVVRTSTERITGFEALLRWNHPVLGAIPPMQFIPVAEETGQIVAIGVLDAERAKAAGVEAVACDRSGFMYHGRVAALIDAARENGLNV